ncbi:hypothetical protein U1Q18_023762 [Sarracenia purpurea var. burkii]
MAQPFGNLIFFCLKFECFFKNTNKVAYFRAQETCACASPELCWSPIAGYLSRCNYVLRELTRPEWQRASAGVQSHSATPPPLDDKKKNLCINNDLMLQCQNV